MGLIEKLNEINACKEDIKAALKEKCGDTYMDDVAFSGYADKIRALQLESGDTPAPTPSADYIYSNGYLTDGTEVNEVVNFLPYEITVDDSGICELFLTCGVEIPVYTGENYDIVFTVDVPTTYEIIGFAYLDELNNDKPVDQPYKANPRYTTIVRNEVTYNSYIKEVTDTDMGSEELAIAPVKYKITIQKK
jgi:hypothetical protein